MNTDKKQDKTIDEIDAAIIDAVRKNSINKEMPCGEATRIATSLSKPMKDVGAACDLLEIHITKCQLGLFGYPPQKKIISADQSVGRELEKAIRERLVKGTLPCDAAWEIAENLALPKMKIASACETLKIKIKPCQLGAF
jgi:hypothetical protein